MVKNKNDYFKLMVTQMSFCVKASELLCSVMSRFDAVAVQSSGDKMHSIEHEADRVYRDILTRLSTEFIAPIDHEDILRLVQIIDDVTDGLDEAMMDLYMYRVQKAPSEASRCAALVNDCVKELAFAVDELKNFRKPLKLREHINKINAIEAEADRLYVEAIHVLFGSDAGTKELLGAKAIYEGLENCCDLCEHAADTIEQIILKNT